jgi:hypothetical protein
MVLVIIVAVAWLVILGPSLMKRRSRSVGEIGSISHFHRQLRVLEHSSPPPIVAPAYRLRAVAGTADLQAGPSYPEIAAVPVLSVVGADRLPRPALAFLGVEEGEAAAGRAVPPRSSPGWLPVGDDRFGDPGAPVGSDLAPARMVDSLTRHRLRRRRRDILGVLVAIFVGTLMIGLMPGAAVVWTLTALSGLALVAYVSLLVHLRKMAAERERTVHYLRPGSERAGTSRVPVTMSGRYAHPSNQAASAQ